MNSAVCGSSNLSVSEQYRNMFVVRKLRPTESLARATSKDLFGTDPNDEYGNAENNVEEPIELDED